MATSKALRNDPLSVLEIAPASVWSKRQERSPLGSLMAELSRIDCSAGSPATAPGSLASLRSIDQVVSPFHSDPRRSQPQVRSGLKRPTWQTAYIPSGHTVQPLAVRWRPRVGAMLLKLVTMGAALLMAMPESRPL